MCCLSFGVRDLSSRVESECSGEREVGSEGNVRVVPTIHCCFENSLLISFREGQRIFMCVCVLFLFFLQVLKKK